ncbi:hypothetical protein [Filimonas effusa]|uniref:Phosphatase PAP2 family protein n=1 Tax=Filimonas effusa TaxID=2508721 RepID=A0A4Q1D7L6_9BACT|nr:hypothetical protein [Filimonas effusa]RXK83697.1 hypothetical protein ESB13_16590 [Filimonas effusa]
MSDNQTVTTQPMPVKLLAKLVSYLFHPLFIPTFVFLWLLFRFPYEFAGISPVAVRYRIFSVFWMTAFFPAFAVLLLWRLKFINSIMLRTPKDRIVPYMITMFFYWWMWYLSRNFTDQPIVIKCFYLGIFLTTVAGLVVNNFLKISMHAMGAAGAMAFVILTCFTYGMHLGADISVAVVATGLICTARLALSEHAAAEVYIGLLAGVTCQFIAYYFTMIF